MREDRTSMQPTDLMTPEDRLKAEAELRGFRAEAAAGLAKSKLSALAALKLCPGASLGKIIDFFELSCNIVGFKYQIYTEAEELGCVRAVAMDLLLREIREEYPDGWLAELPVVEERLHPLIRASLERVDEEFKSRFLSSRSQPLTVLISWVSGLGRYTSRAEYEQFGDAIIKELTEIDPPPDGWVPTYPDDPRITQLFDKHWKV